VFTRRGSLKSTTKLTNSQSSTELSSHENHVANAVSIMWKFKAISIFAVLASNISFVKGADCDLTQPRKEGDPSGADIASFLSGTLNDPNGIICAGGFPPLNNNIATYNANLMLFNVTREDATKPIENCNEAFSNIIEQCIQNDNYWGGVWSLNGFTYTIADIVFPENGIRGPEDPGSHTTPPPSTSTVLTETDSAGSLVTLTVRQLQKAVFHFIF
jgi:hypothetical protein